ncbi:MAG: ADP compounds hydrolase NudE [Gammaproteobacteria bacterium]|nr:ADP compounds hydrolase NudE [Gammaproteobacteria bacterium]
MPSTKPKILKCSEIAKTRNFRIEEVKLEFSNGQARTYERLSNRSQGAVLILALIKPDEFLMIREYAVGMERYELTLPKGKIDPGESILDAANRELIEETGHRSARLTHLQSLSLASGYSTHMTHIVLAEELQADYAEGDEPEPLEVIPWQISDIQQLISHPECSEARTFAALYIAQQHLAQRNADDT